MNALALILIVLAFILAVLRFFINDGRLTAGAILAVIVEQLLSGGVKWG